MSSEIHFPIDDLDAALARLAHVVTPEEAPLLLKDLVSATTEHDQTGSAQAMVDSLNGWWRLCLLREAGDLEVALAQADEIYEELVAGRREAVDIDDAISQLRSA